MQQATAIIRSVCLQRNAGICITSTTSDTASAWKVSWISVRTLISSFSFIGSVGGRYYNEGEDNQYNLHVRVNGGNSYGNLEFAEAHTGNAVAATFSGFINGYTNFTGTVTYLTDS